MALGPLELYLWFCAKAMSTGNQSQVLWRNSKNSLTPESSCHSTQRVILSQGENGLDLGGGDIIIFWIYLTSLNYIFKMVIMLIFIDIARIFF